MTAAPLPLSWQPSLLDGDAISWDPTFAGMTRHVLPAGAWVDYVPGWLRGSGEVFQTLLDSVEWQSRVVPMYDRHVAEPRLTARWKLEDADLPIAELCSMGAALSGRYGVDFASVGANLYRDGRDSVAWHGDRVARDLPEAVIAIVSVGASRPFRLRPKGGGPSRAFLLGGGDLLVMGGSCQRTWDHTVPKVRAAGPRISITFRHVYDR